jgi:hypothetical protein
MRPLSAASKNVLVLPDAGVMTLLLPSTPAFATGPCERTCSYPE